MRPAASEIFATLTREAFVDAMRRRIVPVIAVISLVSLLAVDSCTSCSSGSLVQNGQEVPVAAIAGWAGMVIFTALALWTMVLAGLLAADHLAETLSDGSALLVLARPVRRSEFVAARLAGALGIAYATGAVVLTGTALLLYSRHDVSLAAAAWGGLACAAGAFVVAAFAMALSLVLTRIATALTVLVGVAAISFANTFALFGAQLGEVARMVQHFAPPLCTAVVVALSPWIHPAVPKVDPVIVVLKLATWAVISWMTLSQVFRRRELGR